VEAPILLNVKKSLTATAFYDKVSGHFFLWHSHHWKFIGIGGFIKL